MIGQVPAPIAVVTDTGPCFRGAVSAQVFTGDTVAGIEWLPGLTAL